LRSAARIQKPKRKNRASQPWGKTHERVRKAKKRKDQVCSRVTREKEYPGREIRKGEKPNRKIKCE